MSVHNVTSPDWICISLCWLTSDRTDNSVEIKGTENMFKRITFVLPLAATMSFVLKPRICCPLFWPFIVCSAALKWENPAVCCNVRFCKGLYEWGRCGREPVWLSLQVVHRSDKLELETDFSSSGLVHWATQSAYDLQLDASFTSSIHHVVQGQAWSSLQLPRQWRWRTWFPASLGKLPKSCWRWEQGQMFQRSCLGVSGLFSILPRHLIHLVNWHLSYSLYLSVIISHQVCGHIYCTKSLRFLPHQRRDGPCPDSRLR